jgi:hypothetical protein
VIPVYDAAGNVIETHEHKGEFKGSDLDQPAKREQEWQLCKRRAA